MWALTTLVHVQANHVYEMTQHRDAKGQEAVNKRVIDLQTLEKPSMWLLLLHMQFENCDMSSKVISFLKTKVHSVGR